MLRDDILCHLAGDNNDTKLKVPKRKVMAVTPEMVLPGLLDSLLDNRGHIAIVVDEFGRVPVLLTLEDILETILGIEIVDETDTAVDLQGLARKKWQEGVKKHGLIE